MKIISVKIGTNLNRNTVAIPDNKTIREALDENEINYATSTVFLDGATLKPGDMDKTFEDFNINESCYLIAAQKTENA